MAADIELFGVAQMSRDEVKRYNMQAHKVGRHLCPMCLQEFDWTEENFYRCGVTAAGVVRLHTNCRTCELDDRKRVLKQRYATDAAYRARKREYAQAVRANESDVMREKRRAQHRIYNRKYEEAHRRKKPFVAATLAEVDLQRIGYWEVIWINRTLEQERRRVCVDCRAVLALTLVNFRKYGRRRGSAKAYQLHVCRVCEKARRDGTN